MAEDRLERYAAARTFIKTNTSRSVATLTLSELKNLVIAVGQMLDLTDKDGNIKKDI